MNDDLHDLAAAYAIDALAPEERAAFEARLHEDPALEAEVTAHRETAARLGNLTATPPPAGLRRSIMDEVASTTQLPDVAAAVTPPASIDTARDRRRRTTVVLGVAAAVAALVIGGIVIQSRGGAPGVDDVLSASDAVVTILESEQGDSLEVVWSAGRDEAAVVADGLAPPPVGRTYQLWFLLDDGVSSAGVFEPDEAGEVAVVLDLDDLDGSGWAVTIEPAGGSTEPTTDIVFSGFIT